MTLGKLMNEAPDTRTGSLLSQWRLLGPGLVTGAADDDPSGIGTHSQIGAQFVLWAFLDLSIQLSLDGRYPGGCGRNRKSYRARYRPQS